jgi:hypothetical protein
LKLYREGGLAALRPQRRRDSENYTRQEIADWRYEQIKEAAAEDVGLFCFRWNRNFPCLVIVVNQAWE